MSAEIVPMAPRRQRPRQPLISEMTSAYGEALLTRTTDPLRSAFFAGLGAGYSTAFGFATRDALDAARQVPGASATHIDFRIPRPSDTEDILKACGVRYGYLLGTSEHPDAQDCATCGDRIVISDDDYERCDDGYFCGAGADCSRIWHANGPAFCGGE